jgi:3alpha(or 20beta)-hydroxysteroid dehydrogenase
MGKLDGRVVLVTGAARGQGEQEARLFAAEGAKVVVADVLDEQGEALAKELGRASYVHLDVGEEADWSAAVGAAKGVRADRRAGQQRGDPAVQLPCGHAP